MGRQTAVMYALAMIVVIVGVDILFLRHRPMARLMVNVGIVLVFGAFYLVREAPVSTGERGGSARESNSPNAA